MSGQATDLERWSDPRQLRPEWESRSRFAGTLVPPGAVLLDLGCGAMSLERFLPAGCTYIPCDVVRRDERTIVCDFNREDPPARNDVSMVSALGVLEYIANPAAFLRRLRAYRVPMIMSYCPRDFSGALNRPGLGWVNHLSAAELERGFRAAGFAVTLRLRIDPIQYLYRVEPSEDRRGDEKAVLVLSYNNIGNFGDRLGYHLVNDMLPANSSVIHAHFDPWDVPDTDFDLVMLGIGNSLFAPLLNDRLYGLLDRSGSVIGVFGTQYRERIDPSAMARVLDRVDHWYARYEDDIAFYGKGRSNVSHLGDWLINAFPMTRGDRPEVLNVGDEIWNNLPLDRVIQEIQSYARVHSTRLHPLLCALTSAWEVSYVEQRDAAGLASGKFESMLKDVFGKVWPEEKFFRVDRAAVAKYKEATGAATSNLRTRVARTLAASGAL